MPIVTIRVCHNGHRFKKSSDCNSCPECEREKKPAEGFLSELSSPARRALLAQGIDSPARLAGFTEKDLLSLHGIGPSTIPKLRKWLKKR